MNISVDKNELSLIMRGLSLREEECDNAMISCRKVLDSMEDPDEDDPMYENMAYWQEQYSKANTLWFKLMEQGKGNSNG